MRFKEYISGRRASFTAQGDFVRFALADPDFPDVQSWAQLEAYLKQSPLPDARRHCPAAETVWSSYSKTVGRSRAAS